MRLENGLGAEDFIFALRFSALAALVIRLVNYQAKVLCSAEGHTDFSFFVTF